MGKKSRAYAVFLEITGKDKFSAVFSKAGKGLRSFGGLVASPLKALDSLSRGLGGFLEKVPGLAILGKTALWAGNKIKGMALEASEFGSKFNDLSVQSGIGARALQEVAYAADQAGVPFEEFRAGLQKMAATLGKGVSGKQLFASIGKGANAFAAALKKAKGPGAQFELVLSQMAAIPNATKRAAFGMQFFGRAGVKLAGLAGDGADGIKKMREEAEKLGLVMSDDEIRRADEFGDTWAALGKVFESGKRDFGSGLIQGLLPAMGDLLTDTKANRREIGLMLKEWGRKVAGGIVDGVQWLKGAFEWSKGAVAWLGDFGLPALGVALSVLSKNPFFLVLTAAVEAMKWLVDHTPKPATQTEKDAARLAARSDRNSFGFGSAMATFGAATQGQTGPMGWMDAMIGVGANMVNQDAADAAAAQRQAMFFPAVVANEFAKDPTNFLGGTFSDPAPQSMTVTVDINAPDGVVNGKPDVKTTSGVSAKTTKKGAGTRTDAHLKGNGS